MTLAELRKAYPHIKEEEAKQFIEGHTEITKTYIITKSIKNDRPGTEYKQRYSNETTLNILLEGDEFEVTEWLNELVQEFKYKGQDIYNLVAINYPDAKPTTFTISLYEEEEQGEQVTITFEELTAMIREVK